MKNINYHYFYIIGFLIVIIIYLLSINLALNENVIPYISFAATLSSLLLAILAIILTFLSNSSSVNTLSLLKDSANVISEHSKGLSGISETIKNNLEIIPDVLKNMEKKIDCLPDKLIEFSFANTKQLKQNILNIDENIKEMYLDNSVYLNLFFLYAFYLSHKNKLPFNVKIHVKSMSDSGNIMLFYAAGIAQSAEALNLLKVNYDNHTLIITEYDDYIANNIKKKLENSIEKIVRDDRKIKIKNDVLDLELNMNK